MWLPAIALMLFQSAEEGIKALEQQRYDAAEQIFGKLATANPKDYSLHFHLGLAQSLQGRYAESIAAYRKVLELKPGLYEAQLNLGISLLNTKQAAEAVPLLESAAAQKPKEVRPAFYLAEALAESGKDAEAAFKSVLALDEKSGAAWHGLGRAQMKSNRLEEAAASFEKAIAIEPAYRSSLLELASLYEKAKQPKAAIAIYEKFPDDPGARERMGELLLESGEVKSAIPQLEAAVAKSPTAANRFALAMAYNASKEFAKSEALLAEAVKSEPGNLGLVMALARVLREQKKYGPAAQQFFAATKLSAASTEAWSDLAGMLILLEQDQQALIALDKVRELGGEKAAHHFFRAIVLDRQKLFEPALASYEKFLETSNGNPDEEFKARQRVRILKKEVSKR